MRGRPPRLWRAARIVRVVGYVALVLIIAFVGTVVYSAAHVRPQFNGGSPTASLLSSNSTVELELGLNLSNPGAYAVTGVGISAEVRMSDGTLIARGGSPDLVVPANSVTEVPIHVWVPLGVGSDVLLTHDVPLLQAFWANATFESLFTLHFNDTRNTTWGAPFYEFNATPGTPTVNPNGTASVPVQLSWQNSAAFAEQGSLDVQVLSGGGQVCGSSELPVDVPGGSGAFLTPTFYLSSGCDPSGGSLVATFTGSGLTFTFPPEAIP